MSGLAPPGLLVACAILVAGGGLVLAYMLYRSLVLGVSDVEDEPHRLRVCGAMSGVTLLLAVVAGLAW